MLIKHGTAGVFLNGFKNEQSFELIGEEILKVDEVQAQKIKFKVYVNEHNSLSQHKHTD